MATFTAANASFEIPGGGEIFIPTNPGGIAPKVYIRSGDLIRILSLDQIGAQSLRQKGVQVTNAQQAFDEGIKIFQQEYGVNYYDLPQRNIADVEAAFGRGRLSELPGQLRDVSGIDEFKQLVQTAQPGGDVDISQGQTVNAQGQLIDAQGKVLGSAINPNSLTVPSPAPTGQNLSAGQLSTDTPTTQTAPVNAPNVNLQPGATGSDVEQLQRYLVANGYMTQEEMNTGPGIYGPRTTEAVKRLQQSLGVDNSTGVGYYGPRTIAAISGTPGGVPVQLANGQTVYIDSTGKAVDAQGNPVSNDTIAQSSTTNLPPGSVPTDTPEDADLEGLLNNPNLTDDQRDVVKELFDALTRYDEQKVARMKEAFDAAMEFSDPYFKAQIKLTTDALERGLTSRENDLQFKETQLSNTLNDLRQNVASSKDYLDFQKRQELGALERRYTSDLEDTRQNLAATGKTSSSVRAAKETLLEETFGDLRESTDRRFVENTNTLNTQQTQAERDTALELARLQQLTAEGKLSDIRTAEEALGSERLAGLGYAPLGDIGSSIDRQRLADATTFSSSAGFVF